MALTIKAVGTPNYQRFAETWMALIAARDGYEIVPGSVKVELKEKGGKNDESRDRNG